MQANLLIVRHPSRQDADKNKMVLGWNGSWWEPVQWDWLLPERRTDYFSHWMKMPEAPK